ncbi:MAG: LysR family transcriptional regulator, partial [Pseudomonadota bacterium]
AAANEIDVTSGAVSQQVRKLEQSLGVALFRRLPHGLDLTLEGQRYLPRITRIFEDLTAATEDIAPEMNGKKFKVGVCPRAVEVLPEGWPFSGESLKPFLRERIVTGDLERIRTGEIECVVRLGGDAEHALEVLDIAPGNTACTGSVSLQVVCPASLAHCRQIDEVVASLRALAAGRL